MAHTVIPVRKTELHFRMLDCIFQGKTQNNHRIWLIFNLILLEWSELHYNCVSVYVYVYVSVRYNKTECQKVETYANGTHWMFDYKCFDAHHIMAISLAYWIFIVFQKSIFTPVFGYNYLTHVLQVYLRIFCSDFGFVISMNLKFIWYASDWSPVNL